jgi:glycerate 2-kinase
VTRSRTVVIAPDSFKGSLDAGQVAAAIASGWSAARPGDRVVGVPLADGGEGTINAVEAATPGAVRYTVAGLRGPDDRSVDADWLALPDGTALIELAAAAGLPQMAELDPLGAHTRGLGQLIAAVLDAGARRLLLTLGGSATTDGATGALRELGLELRDAAGQRLADGGGALTGLAELDTARLRPPPPGGVEILSDVDNPLLGPRGAATVFGPQKGAGPAEIEQLEAALTRLAELAGGDPDAPGAGAAGGAGYGLATLWGATMRPGSQVIAELAQLPALLEQADVVITGEGALDDTSLHGKVIGHVLDLAHAAGVPVAVVAGTVLTEQSPTSHTIATTDLAGDLETSMADPARWLHQAGRTLATDADDIFGGHTS